MLRRALIGIIRVTWTISRGHLLFFTELDKLLASLLNFELKADLLQQELNDLELEHFPSRVFVAVRCNGEKTLQELFAER